MNTREISRRLLRIILTVLVLLLCLTPSMADGNTEEAARSTPAFADAELTAVFLFCLSAVGRHNVT